MSHECSALSFAKYRNFYVFLDIPDHSARLVVRPFRTSDYIATCQKPISAFYTAVRKCSCTACACCCRLIQGVAVTGLAHCLFICLSVYSRCAPHTIRVLKRAAISLEIPSHLPSLLSLFSALCTALPIPHLYVAHFGALCTRMVTTAGSFKSTHW